jgi:hypothetical protein
MPTRLLACVLVALPFASSAALAAPPWEERHNLTAEEYAKAAKEFAEKGYRPLQLGAVAVGKEVRFAAVWEKNDAPAREARHDLTAKQYEKLAGEMKDKGFRPVEILGYGVEGDVRFAAIWEKAAKDSPEVEARHDISGDDYRKLYAELTNKGYRPQRVSGFAVGKETRYATIWEKAPKGAEWHTRRDLTADQYQEVFDEQLKKGNRLIQVCGYTIDGQVRFAGVWEKSPGQNWHAHHGLSAKDYETTTARLKEKGFRPVQVSGFAVGKEVRYSGVWVRD